MPSLNTIEQVQSYLASLVDLVYKQESVSSVLDLPPEKVRVLDNASPYIKIPKIIFDGGLRNYDRGDGAKKGGITLDWEYMKLEQDRGRAFNIDVVENMESLGVILAMMSSEYIRIHVSPELDAYRFWTRTIQVVVLTVLGFMIPIFSSINAINILEWKFIE